MQDDATFNKTAMLLICLLHVLSLMDCSVANAFKDYYLAFFTLFEGKINNTAPGMLALYNMLLNH